MDDQIESRFLRRLIPEVEKLLQDAVDFELLYAAELEQVDPEFLDSARNLLHYLGVRRHDIRKLQEHLSSLGLSSLGRMEAHTLATLNAVFGALHRLTGDQAPEAIERRPPVGFRSGPALLADHANALLGNPPARSPGRIMVTMPSEAAHDPDLVRALLQAGMTNMRINCAHDGPAAWVAMVGHLRRAEQELGVHCRVLADLAGPKLRTGTIGGGERIVKVRPQRDNRGRVVTNARVWLHASDTSSQAPDDVDAALPIDAGLLDRMEAGDRLEFRDTRDRRRRLTVTTRHDQGAIAECDRTFYLEAGHPLQLKRRGHKLAVGAVGSLPESAPTLTLYRGDRLQVTREELHGHPAVRDVSGQVVAPARVPCTLGAIFSRVQAGERVWFDDGKIGGRIVAVSQDDFTVEIEHARASGSRLRADKGINLPDTTFDLPALTAKDLDDLAVVAPHVDMVGLSFVRRPDDIELLVDRLNDLNAGHLGIVLKIENRRAFDRLPRILLAALRSPPVGIMVARGDLAVEMGFERLAEVQEEILWMCEAAHVPVIWATQVLEGLAKTGAPSRAEVTDAAMSGRAECVMLNKGPYIIDATRFLGAVLDRMAFHQSKKSSTLRQLSVSQMT
ncbi:MAG: pyruvate kinase [Chromatiaceae bacterium]|nr:pyruvate kinase [Chromatiaceae bacterium]